MTEAEQIDLEWTTTRAFNDAAHLREITKAAYHDKHLIKLMREASTMLFAAAERMDRNGDHHGCYRGEAAE